MGLLISRCQRSKLNEAREMEEDVDSFSMQSSWYKHLPVVPYTICYAMPRYGKEIDARWGTINENSQARLRWDFIFDENDLLARRRNNNAALVDVALKFPILVNSFLSGAQNTALTVQRFGYQNVFPWVALHYPEEYNTFRPPVNASSSTSFYKQSTASMLDQVAKLECRRQKEHIVNQLRMIRRELQNLGYTTEIAKLINETD